MAAPPDPQMQAVLDQLRALGPKPIESLSAEEARKQPTPADAAMALLKQRGMETKEPVANVDERRIPGLVGEVGLRIYTPEGDAPFPVLVYFHGGGWVIAGLDAYDASCRALCNAVGCVVVSVDYRQAPEHPFPAAVEDAYAATQWVMANAGAIGGDPARVAVAGESAGGNLATVVCLLARDQGGMMPVHQLLVYPVTSGSLDFPSIEENAEVKPLNKAMLPWFVGQYVPIDADRRSPYFSPLDAESLSGLPPATMILAEIDPLRDEGRAYAERLREAGVPAEMTVYPGVTHEFFGMRAVVDRAKAAVQEAATHLRAAFGRPAISGAVDRSWVTPGTPVVASDGEEVGTVKAVREGDILIDRPMKRDIFVPYDAISDSDGMVRVAVASGQIDQMGWPNP